MTKARKLTRSPLARAGRANGSPASVQGGVETLVFTSGIGESAAAIRQRVGHGAAGPGVEIDAATVTAAKA